MFQIQFNRSILGWETALTEFDGGATEYATLKDAQAAMHGVIKVKFAP
jgi:hypothetical protein